ncbi:MAG: SPOR domain-containing protein [Desulfuromonadales bacterium]
MMKLKIIFCLGPILPFVTILFIMTPCFALGSETGLKYVEQAERFLIEGQYLPAVLSYRKAISEGVSDPAILRNMSLAYYDLRMLDEATESMEMAVEASPKDPNLLAELGILYGARGNLKKSIARLQESLQMDPSQGDAYLYLGLSLMRQGKTDLAWQAARVGEKLHFNQDLLLEKLLQLKAPEPKQYPFQRPSPTIALRQIMLDSKEQGEKLIARWNRGDYLEEFFAGLNPDVDRFSGGYIGAFTNAELKPEIFAAVSDSNIYDPPVVVNSGDTYLLVQRIWSFDPIYWSESEKQRTADRPARRLSSEAISKTSESLPVKLERKSDLGAKDSHDSGKVDPDKIRLYAGSYHQEKYAIERVDNLRAEGFLAYYLTEKKSDGGTLFNVIAGEYSSRKEALEAKDKLGEKGYESFLSGR